MRGGVSEAQADAGRRDRRRAPSGIGDFSRLWRPRNVELPALAGAALRAVLCTGYLAPLGCRHIANPNKRGHIERVNAMLGFETPLLVPPVELLETES